MGIGMQITYLGLPGTASMEAEAGLQLLRLQAYGINFADCRLAIEHLIRRSGSSLYEVRLDIAIPPHGLRRIGRCVRDSVEAAIRCAFDMAMRVIQILSRHGKL
jgi:hypothetical protein